MGKDVTEQEKYFTSFLSYFDYYDISFEEKTESSINKVERDFEKIDDLETRIVETLVDANIPEKLFYHRLWEKITDTVLFPNETAQTAFLCALWLDTRIPYYQLEDGRRMENETYRAILEDISSYQKKVNFIMSKPFQQKTQRASLLMKLADEIDEDDKRIVFWSYVLSRTSSYYFDYILDFLKQKGFDDQIPVLSEAEHQS